MRIPLDQTTSNSIQSQRVTQRRGLNNLDLSAVIGTQTPVSSLPILDKKKKKEEKSGLFDELCGKQVQLNRSAISFVKKFKTLNSSSNGDNRKRTRDVIDGQSSSPSLSIASTTIEKAIWES